MLFDLVIRGGTLVTARESRLADVGITKETIACVSDQSLQGRREIDASGLLVMPGGVDPHVHLSCADLPRGPEHWVDDFESGSRAALVGGITTVGNMTFVHPHEPLLRGLEREREYVAAEAIADVFVHTVLSHPHAESAAQAEKVWQAGQPSLKMFMSMPTFDPNLVLYVRAMEAAAGAGATVLIHCEDAGCIACCTHLLAQIGRTHIRHFPATRPPVSELLAVQRAIALCELTRCRMYIVHLSTAAALNACAEARARGLPLFVETRPMYLHLTQQAFAGDDAGLYVGQPPLRSQADADALWAGLLDGTVDTLGSDHAAWARAAKVAPEHDIREPRPGVADLETMRPMLFSEGVKKRGLSLERFVALTAETPARLFGLFPQKGILAEGSDADLVVWDPERTREVRGAEMQSRAGYSVYDGKIVTGWPVYTVRRGEIAYSASDGIQARPGSGRMIARQRTP
jgi:dihydropyrimidinase